MGSQDNTAARRQAGKAARQNPCGKASGRSAGLSSTSPPFRLSAYSTVTLFARLRGWSTSQPRRTAM